MDRTVARAHGERRTAVGHRGVDLVRAVPGDGHPRVPREPQDADAVLGRVDPDDVDRVRALLPDWLAGAGVRAERQNEDRLAAGERREARRLSRMRDAEEEGAEPLVKCRSDASCERICLSRSSILGI